MIDLLVLVILELIVKLTLKQDIHWSVLIIYWLLRDSLSGQSIGKRVVGLHVINTKGEGATPVEGIVRNIPIAIPFVSIIEYFVMLRNSEGKRIGDLIAHTKVTDLRPQRSDNVFLLGSILIFVIVTLLSWPRIFGQSSTGGSFEGKIDELSKEESKYIVGSGGPFETVSFDNEDYDLAYFVPKTPATGGYFKEYCRKGENLDSWKKLITVQHLPENTDALQMAQMVGDQVQKSTPGAKYQIIKNDETGEVIIDFFVWSEQEQLIEFTVLRYVPAAVYDLEGLLVYQFSYRSNNMGVFKEDLLNNRERWISAMTKFLF
ncbi:MAG: RDD family protein [Nitrospirota bacterium]